MSATSGSQRVLVASTISLFSAACSCLYRIFIVALHDTVNNLANITLSGVFFLILFLLLLAWAGWFGWKFYNARRHQDSLNLRAWQTYIPFMHAPSSSTNYPTPRSAGPIDWIKDKIEAFRNKRSQTGGYEENRGLGGGYEGIGGAGRGRGGRGLEDDAWDSRVGNARDEDPYGPGPYGGTHEEAELGLAGNSGYNHGRTDSGPYGGNSYMGGQTSYAGASRGRSAERGGLAADPFSDANQAPSLRSVSPRPELDTRGHKRNDTLESDGGNTSPISTRKSIFREDVS